MNLTTPAKAFAFVLFIMTLALCCAPEAQGNEAKQESLHCLAKNIYFEARGEPVEGMYAVGYVTKNRVESPLYPNTYCDVVKQRAVRGGKHICQFSWYCDGLSDSVPKDLLPEKAYALSLDVARAVLNDPEEDWLGIGDATHFHANYIRPYWANSLSLKRSVGNHIFYSLEAE